MTIINNNKSIDDCTTESNHPNISFLNSQFNVYYDNNTKCYFYNYAGYGFYYVPKYYYYINNYNMFREAMQNLINVIDYNISYEQLNRYNLLEAYAYLFCKQCLEYFKQNKEYSILDHELASLIQEKIYHILDLCEDVLDYDQLTL
jgi:hypothetical protein